MLRLLLIKTLAVFNFYKRMFDFLMSNLVLYIQVDSPKLLTSWLKIGFEKSNVALVRYFILLGWARWCNAFHPALGEEMAIGSL